jgi:hypothetical protein
VLFLVYSTYYTIKHGAMQNIAFGFASAGIIKSPFSGNSCARKMCHLLLAGYEDAPSFLNQWKLNRSLCYSLYTVYIYTYYTIKHGATQNIAFGFASAGIIKSPFSGNSCARKMCHLFLTSGSY